MLKPAHRHQSLHLTTPQHQILHPPSSTFQFVFVSFFLVSESFAVVFLPSTLLAYAWDIPKPMLSCVYEYGGENYNFMGGAFCFWGFKFTEKEYKEGKKGKVRGYYQREKKLKLAINQNALSRFRLKKDIRHSGSNLPRLPKYSNAFVLNTSHVCNLSAQSKQ